MKAKKFKIVENTPDINSHEHENNHEEHSHSECQHEQEDLNLVTGSLSLLYKLSQEYTEVRKAYDRLLVQTSHALMKCLELRDGYTYGHSMRVMEYSLLIGRKADLSEQELKNLELAAMFHDVGKIGVRDCVLNKESKLNNDEVQKIIKHPDYGYEVLTLIDEFKNIALGVLHHHERYDGKGYPKKLQQNEIPLYARIILVADSFDAMTSTRPYRKMLSVDYAYSELEKNKGTQFDPYFVDIFLSEHKKLTQKIQPAKIIELPTKKKKAA